jgi:ElaB/YqjD/DUF883 family membrane-anchored ribosome-binding protein
MRFRRRAGKLSPASVQQEIKRMEVFFKNLTAEDASLDALADDVSLLLHDAEALVQASVDNLSPDAKAEVESVLQRVKTRGERIRHQALEGARATDRMIRRYPYQSLGTAFALGLVVGFLARRPNRGS